MTPSHAVFRQLFSECLAITDNAFDYVPDASAKYPFIYIGEELTERLPNSELIEDVEQTIHLWGKRTDRGALDDLTLNIHDRLQRLDKAYNYNTELIFYNKQTIPDNTTGDPLLHIVVTVRFRCVKH